MLKNSILWESGTIESPNCLQSVKRQRKRWHTEEINKGYEIDLQVHSSYMWTVANLFDNTKVSAEKFRENKWSGDDFGWLVTNFFFDDINVMISILLF